MPSSDRSLTYLVVGGEFHCGNLQHSGKDRCSFLPEGLDAPKLEAHNVTIELLLLDFVLAVFNFDIDHYRHHALWLKSPIKEYKNKLPKMDEEHKEKLQRVKNEVSRKDLSESKLAKDARFSGDPLTFVTTEEGKRMVQEDTERVERLAVIERNTSKEHKLRQDPRFEKDPLTFFDDEDVKKRLEELEKLPEDPAVEAERRRLEKIKHSTKSNLEWSEMRQRHQRQIADGYAERMKPFEKLKTKVKKKVDNRLQGLLSAEQILEILEDIFEE